MADYGLGPGRRTVAVAPMAVRDVPGQCVISHECPCSGPRQQAAASPSLDEDGRVNLATKDVGVFTPVVVAVNGFCCAGGWHFVNDGDVILCSS